MADRDDAELRRRHSQTEDRTVIGGAPVAGGPTMASSGAFDTVGGGDLGGPGSRDQGDSTSHLRDPVDEGEDASTGLGGGGGSLGGLGSPRQDQGFGTASGGGEGPGGLNEQQDALRAQGQAQGAADATDARDLQDKTRAQSDFGSANNTDNL